jgi:hypothetical protein
MNILKPVQKIAGKMFGRGPKVDDKTRSARLAKCLTCPHLFALTKQCKKCTCFVEEKVLFQNEKCKAGRW